MQPISETEQIDHPWQVIPFSWIEAAFYRWDRRRDTQSVVSLRATNVTAMAAEPTHTGRDNLVIVRRYNDWIDRLIVYPGKGFSDSASVASAIVRDYPSGQTERFPLRINAVAQGGYIYELVRDALPHTQATITPYYPAGESQYYVERLQVTCKNLRAEGYMRLREALDPSLGAALCLPPSLELKMELAAATFALTPSLIVEDVFSISQRLGHTPAYAEAVACAMLP